MLDALNERTIVAQRELAPASSNSVKNLKGKRVKSAYRDALYRPLFQTLEALAAERVLGGTSVMWSTPNHPLFSIVKLNTSQHGHLCTEPSLYEELTTKEELATARSWKHYGQILPGLSKRHRPGDWRDLAERSRLEWFHHALRQSGNTYAFSLNLSEAVECQALKEKKPADWLSKRIHRELSSLLRRKVELWFVFEFSDKKRLHLHGEIAVSETESKDARLALRRAAGEWEETRQHQAKTRKTPTVVWSNYCSKDAFAMKALRLRWVTREAPLRANWIYATNSLRKSARGLYTLKRKAVCELLEMLPKRKFDLAISD